MNVERPPLVITPRLLVGLALGALVAALAALFLGEYEFDLPLPPIAGVLLGLVVGEVIVSVGRVRHPVVAGFAAVYAAVAIALAGAIDANDVEPIKGWVWVAAVIAAVTAAARVIDWRRLRR